MAPAAASGDGRRTDELADPSVHAETRVSRRGFLAKGAAAAGAVASGGALLGAMPAFGAAARADAGSFDHFSVRLHPRGSVRTGTDVALVIVALDAHGNTVRSYDGPVDISDSSGSISVSDLVWSNGIGTATVRFAEPFRNNQVTVVDAPVVSF